MASGYIKDTRCRSRDPGRRSEDPMNRSEFIAVTAVILFGAFVLGWIASWLVHRIARPVRADMTELDHMAQQLHEAEEQRDSAVALLEQREAELSSQVVGARAEAPGQAAAPQEHARPMCSFYVVF